jgi:hypothetical protein
MSSNTTHPATSGEVSARPQKQVLQRGFWLAMALMFSVMAHAQEIEKVQPAGNFRNALVSMPLGIAREVGATGRDLATFRDPPWSILTTGQIGAAAADAVTSLNNLNSRQGYEESGVSRLFIGRHPDAHKYIIAGIVEIGVEAITTHYFQRHGPVKKWYWKALWTLPQSFSLYEHSRASLHNARISAK